MSALSSNFMPSSRSMSRYRLLPQVSRRKVTKLAKRACVSGESSATRRRLVASTLPITACTSMVLRNSITKRSVSRLFSPFSVRSPTRRSRSSGFSSTLCSSALSRDRLPCTSLMATMRRSGCGSMRSMATLMGTSLLVGRALRDFSLRSKLTAGMLTYAGKAMVQQRRSAYEQHHQPEQVMAAQKCGKAHIGDREIRFACSGGGHVHGRHQVRQARGAGTWGRERPAGGSPWRRKTGGRAGLRSRNRGWRCLFPT